MLFYEEQNYERYSAVGVHKKYTLLFSDGHNELELVSHLLYVWRQTLIVLSDSDYLVKEYIV